MVKLKEKIKSLKDRLAKDAVITATALSAAAPSIAAESSSPTSDSSPIAVETNISTTPSNNIIADLSETADEPAFGSAAWQQAQTRSSRPKNKYTANVTVRNDSVTMVGATGGYYTSDAANEIRIIKGDISRNDFGFSNMPAEEDESLILVHENQHRINRTVKKIGTAKLSLHEDYQRNVHDEITALIAEKLEIRRQYKEAVTPETKEAILQKYIQDPAHKAYINAIRSGQINPDGVSPQDFAAEMAFIKDDATRYRADPNDEGYRKQWTNLAMHYLKTNGSEIHSDPAALAAEVHSMYQIGGIDFTQYGNHSDFVLENQSITTADNLLSQGAVPDKIIAFMDIGEGPFKLAETLDVTGLSREQAEQVIQTAIMTQEMSVNLTTDLCLGDTPEFDYDFMARNLREKTALYLNLKSDIWQSNNTLTEQGDTEKFNRLMEQAQTLTLNPYGTEEKDWINWCIKHRTEPFTAEQLATIRHNITTLNGQNINVNTVVANSSETLLPLDGTSVEEVLADKRRKEEENKQFWDEYNATHPQEKPRLSDTYEVEIMDLQSNILSDELQNLTPRNNTIEPMYSPRTTPQYTPLDGGFQLKTPKYANAEFVKTTTADNTITEVVMIDGKKHGAEITTAPDGSLLSFKLYNHGQEIDLTQNKVDMKTEMQDGAKHSYFLLNGERFGTETITLPDGSVKAAFYEEGGILISNTESSSISRTEITRDTLREELLAQQGNTADTSLSRTQNIRIDSRTQNRTQQQTQNTAPARQSSANASIAALNRTR